MDRISLVILCLGAWIGAQAGLTSVASAQSALPRPYYLEPQVRRRRRGQPGRGRTSNRLEQPGP